MITVKLFRTDGAITEVRASGHSGYAEYGNDIVCAAVSTLVQTACLAITELIGDIPYKTDEKNALFAFSIPKVSDRHDIDVILNAMLAGLKNLSSGYPQNIKLEEV